jgi:hypothetical protein
MTNRCSTQIQRDFNMSKRDSLAIGRRRGRSLIGTVLAVALLLMMAIPAQSDDRGSDVVIVPPDARPFGMSYGEWSVRWWQWLIMLPLDPVSTSTPDHTPFDWPNTKDCSTAQVGPVWFLVGLGPDPATVTCDIPAGKALFFPIVNVECSSLELDPFLGQTPTARHDCAENGLNLNGNVRDTGIDMTVTIDRVRINDLKRFRAQSPDFDFAVPPDNILSIPGHTVPGSFGQSTADGFYLMLAPLHAGKHTIHFAASLNTGPLAGFKIDTTYNLTVK